MVSDANHAAKCSCLRFDVHISSAGRAFLNTHPRFPGARLAILSGLVVALCVAAFDAGAQQTDVSVKPDHVYIERAGATQYLVFAFELRNSASDTARIAEIRMRAFDKRGRLLLWDKLDGNGGRPSIEVIGPRTLEPGKVLTVFNPFSELHTATPVDHLTFQFDVQHSHGKPEKLSADVTPIEYRQKTRLILPVAGAIAWAYEGPGFYSHHSRIDLADPFTRDVLGMHHNGQRYALDLVVVDSTGEAYHGERRQKESWVGFDSPIVAPAAGTVLQAENTQPDEMDFDEQLLAKNPKAIIGNYVVIDHGNGEYSALAHFKRGSLTVKPGDQVTQGQVIGHMGRSGMGSGLVHVHYQLQNSPDLMNAEGLPATFVGFRQVGSAVPSAGRINPGWVIVTGALHRSKR